VSDSRTVEDQLREEYVGLISEMERTLLYLDTKVRDLVLQVALASSRHERVVVKSRIKSCESAIGALRRRQEPRLFDEGMAESYSLAALPDLVGVRVLAFPRRKLEEVQRALSPLTEAWRFDPVRGPDKEPLRWPDGKPLVPKFSGVCREVGTSICSEVQVVPALVGLFWEVEHSALYKASPELSGASESPNMKSRAAEILTALVAFDEEFERVIREQEQLLARDRTVPRT
jgi:ppGpp synthetase/RelA/SpoT-type nucleotidyltranferase